MRGGVRERSLRVGNQFTLHVQLHRHYNAFISCPLFVVRSEQTKHNGDLLTYQLADKSIEQLGHSTTGRYSYPRSGSLYQRQIIHLHIFCTTTTLFQWTLCLVVCQRSLRSSATALQSGQFISLIRLSNFNLHQSWHMNWTSSR